MLPQHPPSSPQQDAGAPEPSALPTEAADEMPLPSNPQTFFLGSLLTLAVLAAVYMASSIILPVVLAFVLQLILQPAVLGKAQFWPVANGRCKPPASQRLATALANKLTRIAWTV
jgi:hypothetical protein